MEAHKGMLLAIGLMGTDAAQAATVFAPTDASINFVPLFGDITATLGLFDDTDSGLAGAWLGIDPAGDQVSFTPSGSDYLLANHAGDSFTLIGGPQFRIAAMTLAGWAAPDSVICTEASASCTLGWSGLLPELAVDVEEVTAPPASVPLPASGVLFFGGLLGLAAVARRRTVASGAGG